MSPDAVVAALKDLRDAVERRTAQFRTMLYALVVLVLLILMALSFVIAVQRSNRDILTTIKSATTPGEPLYEQGQESQANALSLLDCMNRRIVAHLPAPSSPRKCFVETPASVYPGTTGP